MPTKPIPLDLDYIVNQNRAGFTMNDIARELGVGGETIRRRLIKNGIKPIIHKTKKTHVTDAFADEAVERYEKGESELSLANRFNTSRVAISGLLRRRGIKRRTASEQGLIRMANMTPEERSALASKAHDAIRGTKKSFSAKVKNALAKQASLSGANETEFFVASDLRNLGIHPIPQLAIGPYNCDLACHPVAVEIWGGHWHFTGRHIARTEERIRYLGNAGWHVLIIIIAERHSSRRYSYGADTGNYMASYINQASSDPSVRREYRMIDCRGETLAGGCCDDDDISVIPAFTSRRNPTTGRYERVPR